MTDERISSAIQDATRALEGNRAWRRIMADQGSVLAIARLVAGSVASMAAKEWGRGTFPGNTTRWTVLGRGELLHSSRRLACTLRYRIRALPGTGRGALVDGPIFPTRRTDSILV